MRMLNSNGYTISGYVEDGQLFISIEDFDGHIVLPAKMVDVIKRYTEEAINSHELEAD